MLRIAQANDLKELEALSFAERALVQAQVGLYDEAIENNQRAIALSDSGEYWNHYMMDRGHILTKAKRFKLARATYTEALRHPYNKDNPQSQFIVNSNLAYIYTITGEVKKNLQVTAEMQRLSAESGVEVDIQWAKSSRAFALFSDGRYAEAKPLFDDAVKWFQDRGFDANLVDIYDGWAQLLMEQGYPKKAYSKLAESVELRDAIKRTQMETESQVYDWVLEAEQSARELESTKQSIALMHSEQTAQRNLFIVLFVGLASIIIIGSIAYRKLQRVNRRLDQANTALDYESNHDALTGALNRRYFQAFIEQATHSTNNSLNALIALVDIDHFKSINDTYGL